MSHRKEGKFSEVKVATLAEKFKKSGRNLLRGAVVEEERYVRINKASYTFIKNDKMMGALNE